MRAFLFLLVPALCFGQTEARLHPTQVGLFGASNGDFFRANPANGGGEWSPTASLQGTLFLPSGATNGQVPKFNGSIWVPSSDAGVTGSGANTQVAYWNSASTLTGSGNMTYNGTTLAVNPTITGVGLSTNGRVEQNISGNPTSNTILNRLIFSGSASLNGLNLDGYRADVELSNTGSPSNMYLNGFRTNVTVPDASTNLTAAGFSANVVNFSTTANGVRGFYGGVSNFTTAGDVNYLNGLQFDVTRYSDTRDAHTARAINARVLDWTTARWANAFGIDLEVVNAKNSYGANMYQVNSRGTGNSQTGIQLQNVISGAGVSGSAIGISLLPNTASSGTMSSYIGIALTQMPGTASDHYFLYNTTGAKSCFSGRIGVNTFGPTADIDILGNFRVTSRTGTATALAGWSSGHFSTDVAIGGGLSLTSGTLSSSNIYNSDGTIPADRTVTVGDNTLILDASGAATTPAEPLIIKGKESSFSTRFLQYHDEAGTWRFRATANSSLITLVGNSRNVEMNGATYSRLSSGASYIEANSGGYIGLAQVTSDPGSPVNSSIWGNTTDNRLKQRFSNGTQQIATVEQDFVGNAVATRTSNFTLAAQDFHLVLDANGGSFTVTLDGTMREGVLYTFECRRNGTNTISFDAGAGYNLAFPGISSFPDDGSVAVGGAGTGDQAPHRNYSCRRMGTNIIFL